MILISFLDAGMTGWKSGQDRKVVSAQDAILVPADRVQAGVSILNEFIALLATSILSTHMSVIVGVSKGREPERNVQIVVWEQSTFRRSF